MEKKTVHRPNLVKKEPLEKSVTKKIPAQTSSSPYAKVRMSPRLSSDVGLIDIDPTSVSADQLKSLGRQKTGPKIISIQKSRATDKTTKNKNLSPSEEEIDEDELLGDQIESHPPDLIPDVIVESHNLKTDDESNGVSNGKNCQVIGSMDITEERSTEQFQGNNLSDDSSKKKEGQSTEVISTSERSGTSKIQDVLMANNEKSNQRFSKKEDFQFTPTEDCESLEIGDIAADFIGYVDYYKNPEHIDNHGKIMHLALNYADVEENRRIQLTGWNDNVPKLQLVASLGNVVEVKGAMVKFKEINKYNFGNMAKFLEIQEYTILNSLGKIDIKPDENKITNTSFASIMNIRGIIRITGNVKTAPRLMKSEQYESKVLGAISDGKKVLEFHLPDKVKIPDIQKGEKIQIQGTLVTKKNGHHFLKVEKVEDILQIPEEPIKDFEWFLNAYIHF